MRLRRVANGFSVVAVVGVLLELVHGWLPDVAGIMLVFESLLPWIAGVVVVVALVGLVLRRGIAAAVVVVVAVLMSLRFVPFPSSAAHASGATPLLRVASQNVDAANTHVGELATALASTGADVIALEELTSSGRQQAAAALDRRYPHMASSATVSIWSRYPIDDSASIDIGLAWRRALRVDITTPKGTWRVYAVHIASVRPGARSERDEMLRRFTSVVRADSSRHLVAIGDFNTAPDDRVFGGLGAALTDVVPSWSPTPFTWPAALPVVQLDHALTRASDARGTLSTLPGHGSDHRGLLLSLWPH